MSKKRWSRIDWIIAVISMSVFGFVALITNLEKGLFFAGAAYAFGIIIQTKLETRKESIREKRFWVLISVLAIIHVILLSLIHIPELKFGMIVLPFMLVDGFIMWWFINWVERLFPGASDSNLKDS
ncbi:MAG: hypothetical protein WBQ60_03185 [Asticcacaulis sp.]